MAGIMLKIDDSSMKKELKGFVKKVKDMTPAMRNFGEYMKRVTDERFKGEHDPEGKPWVKHSSVTLEMSYGMKGKKTRTKKGGLTKGFSRFSARRKILTASHRLRDSTTYQALRRGLRFGTNVIYGRIHQLGGMAGRGRKVKIPARPYLGFSNRDIAEFVRLAKGHLGVT